jgi:hypothetical protein
MTFKTKVGFPLISQKKEYHQDTKSHKVLYIRHKVLASPLCLGDLVAGEYHAADF